MGDHHWKWDLLELGITQTKLAQDLGMSRETIRLAINGKYSKKTMSRIENYIKMKKRKND